MLPKDVETIVQILTERQQNLLGLEKKNNGLYNQVCQKQNRNSGSSDLQLLSRGPNVVCKCIQIFAEHINPITFKAPHKSVLVSRHFAGPQFLSRRAEHEVALGCPLSYMREPIVGISSDSGMSRISKMLAETCKYDVFLCLSVKERKGIWGGGRGNKPAPCDWVEHIG